MTQPTDAQILAELHGLGWAALPPFAREGWEYEAKNTRYAALLIGEVRRLRALVEERRSVE